MLSGKGASWAFVTPRKGIYGDGIQNIFFLKDIVNG